MIIFPIAEKRLHHILEVSAKAAKQVGDAYKVSCERKGSHGC